MKKIIAFLTSVSANSQPENKELRLGDSFLHVTVRGTDTTSCAKNPFTVAVCLHLTIM